MLRPVLGPTVLTENDRKPPATPAPSAPVEDDAGNLDRVADGTKDLKEQIVDPLSSTVSVSHNYPGMSSSLGLAGSALIGVHGIHTVLQGIRENDTPTVVSGAAEMTTASVTLATLGILGGAMVLRPVGASLLLARGTHRLHSRDHGDNLDGASDLVNAATIASNVLKGPAALTLGLGAVGAGLGLLHGLHQIHEGNRLQDQRLKINGTGEIATSAGVALMATGLAVAPGVALAFAGAGLAILQRIPRLRPHVDAFVEEADHVLSPLADRSEVLMGATEHALAPSAHAVERASKAVRQVAAPVLDPIDAASARISAAFMRNAAVGVQWLSKTRAFHAVDHAAGEVGGKLLPAPEPVKPSPAVGAVGLAPAPASAAQSPTPDAPPPESSITPPPLA